MKWFLLLIGGCLGCTFPPYLQNPPDQLHEEWRYKDTQEGIINPVYSAYNVRVTKGVLRADSIQQDMSIYKLESFNWTCIKEKEGPKYVVRSNTGRFLCVEFIKRSDSVVQFKYSNGATSISDVRCGNDDLLLDPWPLLKNVYRSIACPALGGFWVDYYDNLNTYLCGQTQKAPTRIEFSCTQGEGIFVNFDGCSEVRESLLNINDMEKGHIYCRAVWEENNYTFIAASDQALNWIIRYKTDQYKEDKIEMLIMKDLAADVQVTPKITRNYIKAFLSKESMNSLCLDYRPESYCSDVDCTSKEESKYCHKSCNRCHKNEQKFCKFSSNLRGDWLSVKRKEQIEKVKIDRDWVNFTNYESLRCFRSRQQENDTKLVKLSNNGCSPRYFCMKTIRSELSVLQYQIGMPLGWITRSREICSPKQFVHNQDPASWKHFSHTGITRPLVNRKLVESVSCDFPYVVKVTTDLEPGVTCDLVIKPRHSSLLKFRYENCSDSKSKKDVKYTCLYSRRSEQSDELNMVVVAAKDNNPSFSVCIALFKTFSSYKFVMVPNGECFINGDNFYNIKYDPKGAKYLKWPVYDVSKLTKIESRITDGIDTSTITTIDKHVKGVKPTKKMEESHKKDTVVKTDGSYKVHKNPESASNRNIPGFILCLVIVFLHVIAE